jgi:hypothetical protein
MRYHLTGAQTVAGLYIGLFLAALLHPVGIAESLADRVPAARSLIAPARAWGEAVGIAGLKATLGGAMGREVQASVALPAPAIAPPPLAPQSPVEAPITPSRRAISPSEPLRLWVVGDSLLNLAGRELRKALVVSGRAEVAVDYRPSTGLVRLDYHDWPAKLSRRLSRERPPDAVLVMMGANDSQHMVVEGRRLERWGEEWVAEYARRVDRMIGPLRAAGCEVYWAGMPVMKHDRHRRTAAAVNAILVAADQADEGVHYLPTDALFSGPDGDYSRFLTDPEGHRFSARETDGVHFTMSGALWLVAHLAGIIDQDWGVFGPRREADGSLSVPAPQTAILRRDGGTAYVPDLGDPDARFPAIYLLPGGWGEGWPGRADATLQALAAKHGVVLIATGEDGDMDRWLSAEAGLPLHPGARAIAGLSTASEVGLAMNHPERFVSASRLSGVLDNLSPPWILRPRLPDLTPPVLRVWHSTGAEWTEVSAGEAGEEDWRERLSRIVGLHTALLVGEHASP